MHSYASLITLMISLATVYADGGFTATCNNLKLDSYTLIASCKRAKGSSRVTSTLDLDECIVNNGGNLVVSSTNDIWH